MSQSFKQNCYNVEQAFSTSMPVSNPNNGERAALTNPVTANVLPQLDELITKYEELKRRSKYDDCSDINSDDASEFITAALAAIYRIAGPNNQFVRHAEKALEQYKSWQISATIPHTGGALKALRHAVASGYLISIQALIHAKVFSDFLELAE